MDQADQCLGIVGQIGSFPIDQKNRILSAQPLYGKYIEFMSFSQGLIQGMNMGQVHGQRKRRRIVVRRHKVEQVGLVCFIDDADGGIGRLQELIYDTAGIISLGSGTKWNVLKKAKHRNNFLKNSFANSG